MSSSMQPLQFEYEVRDSFQEILQVPQFWSFESRPTSIKQIFMNFGVKKFTI
jgi:hypothetical protein